MTQTTVEVERTQTEEERYEICDECMRAGGDLIKYRSDHMAGKPVHFHKDCAPDGALDLPKPPSMVEESKRKYKGPVVAFDAITGTGALITLGITHLLLARLGSLGPAWGAMTLIAIVFGSCTAWIAYKDANKNRETLR